MSEIIINIPDDVQTKLEVQAKLQQMSVPEFIEKIVKVKAFSNTLNTLRGKIGKVLAANNIFNEDDLNKYLKS